MCFGLATRAQYYLDAEEDCVLSTVKVSHTYVKQTLVRLLYIAEYEIIS